MPEETAHGSATGPGGNGHVSFSDLVRAHYEWDSASDPARSAAVHERFKALLEAFEQETGQIVDAYWCRKEASAVALTRRESQRDGRLRRRRRKLEYRLHRVSDWVTGEVHEIADLLHDSDILATKAARGLEGMPRAVVMQWLLLVESHLLGFIERHRDTPPSPEVVKSFATRERAELRRIEDYYVRTGEKRARMRYVEGMLGFGFVLVAAAAVATAFVLTFFGAFDTDSSLIREFYASAAAGAVGAIVSVMMRMSGRGRYDIDHERTRWEITLIGAYRPVIGSVCGIVAYFLVQTPFIPIEDSAETLPLFVVVAFIAGFSERWMRTMLSGAMRTIGGPDDEDAKTTLVLEVPDDLPTGTTTVEVKTPAAARRARRPRGA
jgi:hypothetical protein